MCGVSDGAYEGRFDCTGWWCFHSVDTFPPEEEEEVEANAEEADLPRKRMFAFVIPTLLLLRGETNREERLATSDSEDLFIMMMMMRVFSLLSLFCFVDVLLRDTRCLSNEVSPRGKQKLLHCIRERERESASRDLHAPREKDRFCSFPLLSIRRAVSRIFCFFFFFFA